MVKPSHSDSNVPLLPRLAGSAVAGVAEMVLFHPVDTVAKRLMSNQGQVAGATFSQSYANFQVAVFRQAASSGVIAKWRSLFPGIGFGFAYKVLQRSYKFGTQPTVRDYLKNNHGQTFINTFGEGASRTFIAATAGSIVGVGEVVLLPLDALKVKMQTVPEQMKDGVFRMLRNDGIALYRGAGWTAARNAPGSFALFGGAAAVKTFLGASSDHATFWQDTLASAGGAMASITVAQPLDVIKTRIQNRPMNSPESGWSILRNMVKTEGYGSFFKGYIPKLIVVGPKLVFSFTIASQTMSFFIRLAQK